jgi:hypothetical protein
MATIKKENRISGLGLLGILILIAIICVIIGFVFEKYMTDKGTIMFFRIMLFAVMLNICIMVFLVFSFSNVKFASGPQGPKGIRGRRGYQGPVDSVAKCSKQSKKLGEARLEKLKSENVVVQRPVLGFNDKY